MWIEIYRVPYTYAIFRKQLGELPRVTGPREFGTLKYFGKPKISSVGLYSVFFLHLFCIHSLTHKWHYLWKQMCLVLWTNYPVYYRKLSKTSLCLGNSRIFDYKITHVWILKELYMKLPALYKETKLTNRTKPEVEKTKNKKNPSNVSYIRSDDQGHKVEKEEIQARNYFKIC